ncbi:MAG: hypothetical protein SOZ81_05070 [Agathobacter sp.]|nr:hypothetical protein [Agathobacter sp.]
MEKKIYDRYELGALKKFNAMIHQDINTVVLSDEKAKLLFNEILKCLNNQKRTDKNGNK